MNKNGLWRIIEVTAAVLIIASALLALSSRQEVEVSKNYVSEDLRDILNEMAKDFELREQILNDDDSSTVAEDAVRDFLNLRIRNIELNYKLNICDAYSGSCGSLPTTEGEIFSEERLISATYNNFNPKVVRVYVWR
jgi:hypothetical protein